MIDTYRMKQSTFNDHCDVRSFLAFGDTIVLARRRVAAADTCYEFIKSFVDPGYAREYANSNYLTRDKYVMLLEVTSSRLRDMALVD